MKGCKIKNYISINELITMSMQSFSDGYFFKGESHNFYEVVCVLEGAVGITAGKKVFSLRSGQLTIHPPLEFHSIRELDGSKPQCIIFSFSASAVRKIKSHIYNVSDTLIKDVTEIYHSSKDVFEFEKEHFSGSEFDFGHTVRGIKDGRGHAACVLAKRLELFLMAALDAPADMEITTRDTQEDNYAKILEIMEEHIDDKLDMTELSRLCGMSAPLIEKIIYKYLRCGAIAYYNTLRMNKAHYLLSQGSSVNNVARALGFSTQNYFSLSFKKHFGCPPSEIKNAFSDK